ncbi:MAG: helix-turn-helix domain-containing protein [Microbacterium sp.]|uniref:helix-turn-helix domain-containing protein n=1 Tax=Microbacterium sp. TaxID=51671 RepID=UPI003A878238
MPESPAFGERYLDPSQTAELLGLSVDEVIALVTERRLRGARLGSPARWRIEASSIVDYIDDETEMTRRKALWEQSQEASFPELWGSGPVRHGD